MCLGLKKDREDIIKKFGIPLDEYPKRCVEQIEEWKNQLEEFTSNEKIEVPSSIEYASQIINSAWTGTPSTIYGNVSNKGLIADLPEGCAVEVPCVIDAKGIHPKCIKDIPTQLIAIMRSNINVQELTVKALVAQDRQYVYHAAMMDPHTGAELDLEQIWQMVDDLLDAHRDWLPDFLKPSV